ncbi:MAG: beta-lactamase family protein, partial [Xanthobacteraceae bacterium]|nr:beta-lactamase family protein [Xanthobacteraceae bacterium]
MQSVSRRDVLQAAAAFTTTASVSAVNPSLTFAEETTGAKPSPLAQIDAVLRNATDAKEVPGVVAMAATDNGILYEGVFGTRDLGKGPAMTRDTVFRIASMTKAVTSVAAMQLVEQGKLKLNEPVPDIDSALSSPQVLEGFDASGAPRLRPAKRPITLRHLLTHTAGFTYEVWDGNTQRYVKTTGMPSTQSGKLAALRTPLAFDPGDRWLYGVNIDWAGRIVEATSGQPLDVYFREHILGPLGMNDTGFVSTPEQRARQVSVHQRKSDGSLEPQPLETPFTPEYYAGGGGLYSTAPDYLT